METQVTIICCWVSDTRKSSAMLDYWSSQSNHRDTFGSTHISIIVSCYSFISFSNASYFSSCLQLFLLSLPPSPSLSVNTMVSIDVLVRYLLLFVYMMLSVLNQIVQDMGHVTWVHVHVTNHGWDQYVMC